MNLPESTLDHVVVYVSDFARARTFYDRSLAPLGMKRLMDIGDDACGYGRGQKPDFWLGAAPASQGGTPITRVHVAFRAHGRGDVDAFYRAALDAGAKDNGAPGLRPMYHPNYYGAFVLDPDGHNIEAVFHG